MVGRVALVILSAGVGVAIGFAGHKFGPPLPAGLVPPPPATETAAPAPSASAPPAASASAPAASASAAAAPPVDVEACTKALFPDGAFAKPGSGVPFVCEEPNLVKGSARMKEAVVNAGAGQTTDAMKEWAVLGFYELPAYALIRDACCPGAPPIEVAETPEGCPSMKSAIEAVVAVSKPDAAEDTVEPVLKDYTKAVKCVVKQKVEKSFGGYDAPASGQQGTLKKTLMRRREAKSPAP